MKNFLNIQALNRFSSDSCIHLSQDLRAGFCTETTRFRYAAAFAAVCLLQATSGSTGEPLRIYVHHRENRARQLLVVRSLWVNGWKPWWRGIYLWRSVETAGRSLFQSAINNRRKFVSISLPLAEQARQLSSLKPDILFCVLGSLKALPGFVTDQKYELPGIKLIVTGGTDRL